MPSFWDLAIFVPTNTLMTLSYAHVQLKQGGGRYIVACTSTHGQDLDPSNFLAWPLNHTKNLALTLDYPALNTPIGHLESLWPFLSCPWFLLWPLDQPQNFEFTLTAWPHFDPGHGWEYSSLCSLSVPPPCKSRVARCLLWAWQFNIHYKRVWPVIDVVEASACVASWKVQRTASGELYFILVLWTNHSAANIYWQGILRFMKKVLANVLVLWE